MALPRKFDRDGRGIIMRSMSGFIVFSVLLCGAMKTQAEALAVRERCRVDMPAAEYSLIDTREPEFTEEIAGVFHGAGRIMFYDRISQQVVAVNCGGGEIFRFGTMGTGPEDHATECSPFLWADDIVAILDHDVPPKVIELSDEGSYLESITLDTTHSVFSPTWIRDRLVCLEAGVRPGNGGFEYDFSVASFDGRGVLLDRRFLWSRSISLKPLRDRSERDLEVFPLLVAAEDRMVVQPDIYEPFLRCYDSELRPIWEREFQVGTYLRAAPEADAPVSGIAPSAYRHPIRGVWLRPDGEVWVELENGMPARSARTYERILPNGTRDGVLSLAGFPDTPGHVIYRGEEIYWSDINLDTEHGSRSLIIFEIDQ